MLKQKNALKKISVATAVTAMSVGLITSFSFESQAIATTGKKPGAIVIGVPPACDCTAPASTCYCIS